MRLIDADLLIAEICKDECERKYCDCDYTCSYIAPVVNAPTVEAVPLDALCEWLGSQGMLAPCYFEQECDKCELKAYWRQKKSDCWKRCLTAWMEGT